MRRKDREITDISEIKSFIFEEKIIRVAFYDRGDIYIVPVNYGFSCSDNEYCFYFHGAKAGRKYELTKKKPNVGFEIDGRYRLIEGETACKYSAKFQSVIGTGIISLIEGADEKKKALDCIMKQQTNCGAWEYSEKVLNETALFRIVVEKMSCKAK